MNKLLLALFALALSTGATARASDASLVLTCSDGVRDGVSVPPAEPKYTVTVRTASAPGRVVASVSQGSKELGRFDLQQFYDGHATYLFSTERVMLRADNIYGCWRKVRLTAPLTSLGFELRVDEITFNRCTPAPPECSH